MPQVCPQFTNKVPLSLKNKKVNFWSLSKQSLKVKEKKGAAATSERKQGPYLTYKLNGNI